MSGLQQEFPGRVVPSNLDATKADSAAACKQLGFKSHGLVIRDSTGQALWSQADHSVAIDDVRAKLKELTAG